MEYGNQIYVFHFLIRKSTFNIISILFQLTIYVIPNGVYLWILIFMASSTKLNINLTSLNRTIVVITILFHILLTFQNDDL